MLKIAFMAFIKLPTHIKTMIINREHVREITEGLLRYAQYRIVNLCNRFANRSITEFKSMIPHLILQIKCDPNIINAIVKSREHAIQVAAGLHYAAQSYERVKKDKMTISFWDLSNFNADVSYLYLEGCYNLRPEVINAIAQGRQYAPKIAEAIYQCRLFAHPIIIEMIAKVFHSKTLQYQGKTITPEIYINNVIVPKYKILGECSLSNKEIDSIITHDKSDKILSVLYWLRRAYILTKHSLLKDGKPCRNVDIVVKNIKYIEYIALTLEAMEIITEAIPGSRAGMKKIDKIANQRQFIAIINRIKRARNEAPLIEQATPLPTNIARLIACFSLGQELGSPGARSVFASSSRRQYETKTATLPTQRLSGLR